MPIPKLVATIALTAIQMAISATRTIEGPRQKELDVTSADPGTPFPNGLGRVRVVAVNFYAEPMKEKKRKRKTKGGKYKEWVYFVTAAYAFAGHETQAIRRIWFDKHLVYDATGETIQSIGQGSTVVEDLDGNRSEFTDLVSFYYGTETQEPDPRMLSYIEALEGEGTCPAHRGKSYIMLKDFPVEKLGNRPPAIVEVEFDGISGDELQYTHLTAFLSDPDYNAPPAFDISSISPNGRYIFSNGFENPILLDRADESISLIDDPTDYQSFYETVIDNDGTVYGVESGSGDIMSLGIGGAGPYTDLPIVGSYTADGIAGTGRLFITPDDQRWFVWLTSSFPTKGVAVYNIDTGDFVALDNPDGGSFQPRWFAQDMHGDVWAVGSDTVATDTYHFWRVVDYAGGGTGADDHVEVAGFESPVTAFPEMVHTPSGWFLSTGTDFYLLNDATFAIEASRDYSAAAVAFYVLTATQPGATEFWVGGSNSSGASFVDIEKIRASDLSTIESHDLADWGIGDTFNFVVSPSYYNRDAIVSVNASLDSVVVRYVDGAIGNLTLGTCVRYFSSLSGLTEGTDYTVHADLDDIPVTGYSWVQSQAKQNIDLLLDMYGCEARIHDGKPHFIKRGGAAGTTVTTPEMAIERDQPETRYKLTVANDTDKPRRAVMTYANVDGSLQAATVKAERRLDAFDGVGELTIDGTTVSLEPDTAQQLIDRWFRRRHFESVKADLRLSNQHLAIEAGDIIPFDFDGTTIVMHIDKVTDSADGSRHIVATNDDPAIAVLGEGVGAPSEGRPPDEIFNPGVSIGEVLDVPLLTDAHDQSAPFVYFAGGPENDVDTYVGTEIHSSDTGDDNTYSPWDGTGSSDPMTHGTVAVAVAQDVLPWIFDSATTMEVVLATGTLSSVTEDQLLNSGSLNLFAYGASGRWLLGQFRTATLTAPLTYEISNIIWGVRGTEYLIGTSEADDRFILLDSAVSIHTMGATEIGDEDWYVAAASGAIPDPDDEVALTFAANAHRPYAPVHGSLTFDTGASDDITIDAVRRTRIGGATVNGQDVPLGEVSEAYEADIYDGPTFKRTLTGTSLPLTYTAAQQTTDFGAPVTTGFEVYLYQMNPTLDLRSLDSLDLAA